MQAVSPTSSECEYVSDAGRLVKARAQVMVRDDGTGLWRPLSGGGMSDVELVETTERRPDDRGSPYRIQGHKLINNDMVLSCSVTKDLRYMSATPTFHHWQTNTERYGLAFQNTSEAAEFKKVVCGTVDKICDELKRRDDDPNDDEFDTLTIEIPDLVHDAEQDSSTVVDETLVTACIDDPATSNEIDLSPLEEVLPAVPPRRVTSTSAAAQRPPFDDIWRVVPRSSMLDHSVSFSSSSRQTQQLTTHPSARLMMQPADSRSTCGSRDEGANQQLSDSPPVPPRPDVVRSESWRPRVEQSVPSRPPPKCQQSAAPVVIRCNRGPSSENRPVQLSSSALTVCQPSHRNQIALESVTGTTNYVYFTEGNVVSLPPTAAVSKDSLKPKSLPWNEVGGNHHPRVRRLADAFHSGSGAAGAMFPDDSCIGGNYVQLALPASGSPVNHIHDYCYPSLEAVLPSGAAEQLQSSTSNRHIRIGASPPPLPTKSRLGWRDCRKRRRRAQMQQQQQQRGLSSLVRLSYGTVEVVSPHRPVTTSSTVVVGSSQVTLDESLGHPARRHRRLSTSLLCFLPCSGRPCPQRRRPSRPIVVNSSSVDRARDVVA